MNMESPTVLVEPRPESAGGQPDAIGQQGISGTEFTANKTTPWRSLRSSFLGLTLSSVLIILVAFFTYLETSQYRAAADQIRNKIERMLDSGSILLADATSRKNNDEILLLLAPVLGDPDVMAVAIELKDGSRLAAYGEPFAKLDPAKILRRPITYVENGQPTQIGTFLVGLTHKRINEELEERLRNNFILALLILVAIVVSSYQSLRVTVMRPMRKLLSAIEGWESDNDPKPVHWTRNDEFGQLISAFNQMQRRQQDSRNSLRIALDAAESADRVKTAFLAIIGHELRTPLNAIIGFSDLLKSQVTNADHGEYLTHINAGGHSLLAMVNDILEITHAQAGNLKLVTEPVNLSSLIDGVAADCREKQPGDAAMIVNAVPDTLAGVTADPSRLGRMLFHLITNALRFTPADGTIRIDAAVSQQVVRVSMTDTGCGIPADKLEALQQPFIEVSGDWETHSVGAGLGLTYVKNMAACHGGTFELESAEGEGTTAIITLPV